MNVFELEASLKLDTKEYSKSLKEAEKQSSQFSDSMKDIEGSTGGLSDEMKDAADAASDAASALEEVKDASSGAFSSSGAGTKFAEDINISSEALNRNKGSLAGVGDALDDYSDSQKRSASETQSSSEAIEAMGAMIAASGVEQGIEKITETLTECVSASETFETSIAKLQTIAGADSIDSLSQDIMDLSSATGIAAEDLANTAYNAISAGTAVSESVGMAETASKLAIAGFTDTDSALSVLTTAINAYGDAAGTATEISDSLIVVQNLGVTTVADLASNMGKAIATASAYSVNLANLESAYISITKAGINTAEGTTYISSMLNELGDSGSEVATVLQEQTGQSFGQLMNSGSSLADVLQILYTNCNEDSEAMMNLWGSAEAGKAASAIINQGITTFNNNLKTVTSSTGITEEAYETMAETGEMAGKRLKNSAQNLKIAIGQQLEPALDNVKSKLGNVVDNVTEWVKENPKAVKTITASVTALGIMVGVMTGYVAIAKVAKTVTGALSAAMASNPIGLMVTAVAGVVGALTAFATICGDAADAEETVADQTKEMTSALSESTEELNSSMGEIKDSYEESSVSAQMTADNARAAAAELEALASQTSLTADEQQREAELVAQLNGLYPEMNLQIDSQTGKLSMANEEIEKYIDNMEKTALAEAYLRAAEDSYDALVEAQTRLTEAKEADAAATARIKYLQAMYNKVVEAGSDSVWSWNGQSKTQSEMLALLTSEIEDTKTEQKKLNNEVVEAEKDVDSATETAEGYTNQYAEMESQIDATTQAEEQSAAAATEVSEAQQEAIDAIQASLDTFKSTLESPLESTWFDQLEVELDESGNKVEVTAAEMAAGLQSQIVEMQTWESNMLAIAGHVSDGVLQYLAEMGPEGAQYVQALATAVQNGDQQVIDQINNDWATKVQISALADEQGQQLVGVVGEAAAGVQEAWSGVEVDTSGIATSAAEGVSQVTQMSDEVETQVTETKNTLQSEFSQIYSDVSTKMGQISASVSNGVSQIRSALSTTLRGPNIQVPHFSMSGAFDAKTNSVPTVHVAWYEKAMHQAALFSEPTLFGAGEAGNEMLVGEKHLEAKINEGVQNAMGGAMRSIADLLEKYLPSCAANRNVYLDGNAVSNVVSKTISRQVSRRRAV